MFNKKHFLVIGILIFFTKTSLSTNQCNRTINGTQMRFSCPSTVSSQLLNLYDLTTAQLDAITSFFTDGSTGTQAGPFTSIPPNICLLRNLQSIRFSNQRIGEVDPPNALINCLANVNTLDLSLNNITIFPARMINGMPLLSTVNFQRNKLNDVFATAFTNLSNLQNIDFSYNQFTSFEFWTLLVPGRVDFSNNQISTITNKYFFDLSSMAEPANVTIFLTNNAPFFNLTDAIYPMYNTCNEVIRKVISPNPITDTTAIFTPSIVQINFGITNFSCDCSQYYFGEVMDANTGGSPWLSPSYLMYNSFCTSGSLFGRSSCLNITQNANSTVDFTQVYPRQCKILNSEPGNLTIKPNLTLPALNATALPYYTTRQMNPGACFFTFSSLTTMSMLCTADTIDSSLMFPSDLLFSTYMSTVTRVNLASTLSTLPQYLCSLPSGTIDLSYENFTTLSDATFPCLDSFRQVNLAGNQISSVNMASGNFSNLTTLDLSSNQLTSLPYSILQPSPSSLRLLDLRNNSITNIDLFLYTLRNITVLLDGNPINASAIVNPSNITIPSIANGTTTGVNISLPSSANTTSVILNDQLALAALVCNVTEVESLYVSLKETFTNVFLDCSCNSINIKSIYGNSTVNITTRYNCSSDNSFNTFLTLTMSNCATALDFTARCSPRVTTGLWDVTTYEMTSQAPLTTPNAPALNSNNNGNADTTRNGLIVGLVVGLVGGAILIAGLIGLVIFLHKKNAAKAGGAGKPIGRATVIGQEGNNAAVKSRMSTRNPRAVKLAPLTSQPSQLPSKPVATMLPAPMTMTSTATALGAVPSSSTATTTAVPLAPTFSKPNPSGPAKGIPLRLDPIRSPSNVNPQYLTSNNLANTTSSFRPINVPRPTPQGPLPPSNSLLNAGGETRYP